ncbi:MAG: ATP-binding cassette domain-containing protein, partial [Rhodospirillales bacterium]|nr:ATP-binding cassette domain-containing protein [Rhodospirillales bacterium]
MADRNDNSGSHIEGMQNDASLLEARGLTKSFPGCIANDGVSFIIHPGEVHALLGENGAGKSTLVKILAGMYPPDGGRIRLGGKDIHFGGSAQTGHAGIAVVQQELSLVPSLSVADNVFLGDTRRGWRTAPRAQARAAMPHLEKVGLGELDP